MVSVHVCYSLVRIMAGHYLFGVYCLRYIQLLVRWWRYCILNCDNFYVRSKITNCPCNLRHCSDIPSGNVGLAILSSINLIGFCQWGIRQTAEVENQMISVERVMEYAELPPEPPLESDDKYRPSSEWPSCGALSFKLLSMRYAENSNRTLRNLTFHIEPQVSRS